ncbi:MAG TPA: hypothetical protein VEQ42_08190, partial [Pyrinomonadaceae bacterium]|nr:hypothetical protein [Pyrinomonadaceae bacterium]
DGAVVGARIEACESGQISPGRVRLSPRAKKFAAIKTSIARPATPDVTPPQPSAAPEPEPAPAA